MQVFTKNGHGIGIFEKKSRDYGISSKNLRDDGIPDYRTPPTTMVMVDNFGLFQFFKSVIVTKSYFLLFTSKICDNDGPCKKLISI